ncbi:MAG: 6-bladed beta-propeller [Rhodothermus sp.]|nr:6-bladed beta-propeller [Rhodothermus sp.]
MSGKRTLWVWIVGGWLLGCSNSSIEKGERWLPEPERLPPPEAFDWLVTGADTTDTTLEQWVARLRSARLLWQRGRLVGADPHSMFGIIKDVAIDKEGRVVVLDFSYQEIRLFDRSGTFVTTVGRQGEGPGEFVQAGHLWFADNDTLYVYDNSRIMFLVYEKQEDNTYQFYRNFVLSKYSSDHFCITQNRLFVYGTFHTFTQGGPLFLEFDLQGNIVWDFNIDGYYTTSNNFVYSTITTATIDCNEELVAVSYLHYPIIDIYTIYSRNKIYNIQLNDIFITPQIYNPKRKSITNFIPSSFIRKYIYTGKIDSYPSMLFLDQDILLYQFIRYEGKNGEIVRSYPLAYLIDIRRRKARRLALRSFPFAKVLAFRDTVLVGQRWDLLQAEVPHIAYYVIPQAESQKAVL